MLLLTKLLPGAKTYLKICGCEATQDGCKRRRPSIDRLAKKLGLIALAIVAVLVAPVSAKTIIYGHDSGGEKVGSKLYCYPNVRVADTGQVTVSTLLSNGQKISFAVFRVNVKFDDKDGETLFLIQQKGQLNGAGFGGTQERTLTTNITVSPSIAKQVKTHKAACGASDPDWAKPLMAALASGVTLFSQSF